MTDDTPSGDNITRPGADKPSRFSGLRNFGKRIVAAKIPLLVFLGVSGALTAVLVWWAFFLPPQDLHSSLHSSVGDVTSTSTSPLGSVEVPPGYSRVELTDSNSVPNVGNSGWICSRSRWEYVGGVTCFVPNGSQLPAGARSVTTASVTTASPNTAAPLASGEADGWMNKIVAIAGALAVVLTALASLGWRPFGRGGESAKHT